MRRTRIASIVIALSTVACTRGLGEASDALRTPASPTSTPSPASTPSPDLGSPVGSIVVRSPLEGDEVGSPVVVSGSARTEGGVVLVRLLDEGGMELAAVDAEIDCGTGCHGSFRVPLAFFVEVRTPGTVQVAEVSAEETALQLREVDVTFVPGV